MSGGSGFVLRPSQIAALVEPALAAATPTSTATSCPTQAAVSNTTGLFTAGEMAGVGCGVGLPLFLALCAALILLRNERKKHAKPKLMYKLPDSCKDEFTFRPPPSAGHDRAPYSPTSTTTRVPSMAPSRRASLKTMGSQKPAHVLSFMERYESMKKKMQVHEMDLGQPTRHEMDSEPPYKEISRHELGDGRVSLD